MIVGGGPAGSSTALAAAQNGISVALLEKEESIAETVRTSGVTWIKDIQEFGIPENCFNPIKNFSFLSPNNTVTISSAKPMAAVLNVRKTYRWLASQAKDAGADIFLKINIKNVIKNTAGDIIGVSGTSPEGNITFNGKVIVDASGFNSTVCKEMGFVTQWRRFGAGAEYEAKAENVDSDTWWLMVGEKYSPAGYAWIFPLGNNMVRIGVGVGKPESNVDPTQRLEELLDADIEPIKKLGKLTITEFHYGLIPNDGLSRSTVFNNLLLVGDSAGQANPLVLEGIRYAIRFGRIAGNVASNAIKSGKTDKDSLYSYEENWRNAIKSKIESAGKIQNRWITLTDAQWDKELDIIRELSPKEFVDFVKAEFKLTSTLQIALHHPKLILKQIFRLVTGK